MIYQTDNDLTEELAIANDIAVAWKCVAVKRPGFNTSDFDLIRDGIVMAVMEVKRRYNDLHAYPDYIIDQAKVSNLIRNASEYGVRGYLCVRFDDGLRYLDPTMGDLLNVRRFSRNEPRDAGDINEVVCVFQLNRFREVRLGS